jgi:hypothetical protein
VDAAGTVGWDTSLELDATGRPHISFYDFTSGDLKYARWDGTRWNIQAVDTMNDVGEYTSLALDAAGNPHISYFNVTNGNLKYARWDGAKWTISTADVSSRVGRFNSLVLDGQGNPHISYQDLGNRDLKYARRDGTRWTIEKVDTTGDVGNFTSLALDSAGSPRIAYHDVIEGDLRYAAKTGTTWSREALDSVQADWFDIDGLVQGRFDTPTTLTGSYMVIICGNTFFPTSGTWTASWQRNALGSMDTGGPSEGDSIPSPLAGAQAIFHPDVNPEVVDGPPIPLPLEQLERLLRDRPELRREIRRW